MELKTSDEWQRIYDNPIVMDPDGWDRTNFQYSWFEERITLDEYKNRVFKSTCYMNKKKESKLYENEGFNQIPTRS